MSVLQGIAGYYGTFGVRGLFAICAYRLTGRPKEITVQPAGIRNPVHLRVRTTDVSVYSEMLVRKEYAFDLPVRPNVIVDAGANIGLASIFFAHQYPNAKIVALEAEASNFEILSRNVKPYPNILPVHGALWNRDGVIRVTEPDPSSRAFGKWGVVTHEGQEGVQIKAMTMRTLMKHANLDSIDLLKVDIEGAEKEVFEDCDWINNVGCMLIELHDRFKPGCSASVSAAMAGFASLQIGEMTIYTRQVHSAC